MPPALRPISSVNPSGPGARPTTWSGGAADVATPLQAVLTGEALGEGPWLTNVLFRALQATARARGGVRATTPRRPAED